MNNLLNQMGYEYKHETNSSPYGVNFKVELYVGRYHGEHWLLTAWKYVK